MVTNTHLTIRILYQDIAGGVGCFTQGLKGSFKTGPTAIPVGMRKTGKHVEGTMKMDGNKEQCNKNSNKKYYDKNM